jgi:hypothetical protein
LLFILESIVLNITRRPLWTRIGLAILLLTAGSVFCVRSVRRSILEVAGRVLVVKDRIGPTDVIVVTLDHDGGTVLEAADLVHSGISTRVAVFADPPDAVDGEFIRRGLPYEDAGARDILQLRALGVRNIEEIPKALPGNENEAPALAAWCDHHRFRSVLVVTHSEYSRRFLRVLDRTMKGHQTKVGICSTRYSDFIPDRWWQTHGGIRTEIEEIERLLLDILRHPIS